jgi:hypothetical protein
MVARQKVCPFNRFAPSRNRLAMPPSHHRTVVAFADRDGALFQLNHNTTLAVAEMGSEQAVTLRQDVPGVHETIRSPG